jgi:CheY-like chemotaxis protein/GAF domain-containing protein
MPGVDGFELCVAVRNDTALSHLPIVLQSSAFTEREDLKLAADCGADEFAVKTPTMDGLLDALARVLRRGPRLVSVPRHDDLADAYLTRLKHQLDLQNALNMSMARRSALRDTELDVLNHIAEALGERRDVRATLGEVLAACVHGGDLSLALLYLHDPDGHFQLRAATGQVWRGDRSAPGSPDLDLMLHLAAQLSRPVNVPGPDVDPDAAHRVLRAAGLASVLLIPLRLHGRDHGVLLFGAERRELANPEWAAYARAVGVHVAQAITLSRLLGARADSDQVAMERRRRLGAACAGVAALLPPGEVPRSVAAALADPSLVELCNLVDLAPELFHAGVVEAEGCGLALAWAIRDLVDAPAGSHRPARVVETDGTWILRWRDAERPLPSRAVAEAILLAHGGQRVVRAETPGVLSLRLPRPPPMPVTSLGGEGFEGRGPPLPPRLQG